MKKLIFIFAVLFVLMQIGLCSATLSFSNYASMDKSEQYGKYGKIDVYDGNVVFPDVKMASYVLTDNTDQCLINCKASGTIELFYDGRLFDDMKFLGGNVKTSSIYVSENYDVDVPDYKDNCKDIEYQNITSGKTETKQECTSEQIGSHKETRTRDVLYNGEMLKAGTYTWRIEASKNIQDKIDWVGVSNDVELKQWTWWNTDWQKKELINITGVIPANYSQLLIIQKTADMNAGFSDLRFLNQSENAEFPYWIEMSNSTTAWVWVMIQDNSSIYMYYKNAGATTTSDITTAFLYGTDFPGTSLPTGWDCTGSTCAVAGSWLNISKSTSTYKRIMYQTNYTNSTIMAKGYGTGKNSCFGLVSREQSKVGTTGDTGNGYYLHRSLNAVAIELLVWNGAGAVKGTVMSAGNAGNYQPNMTEKITLKAISGTFNMSVNTPFNNQTANYSVQGTNGTYGTFPTGFNGIQYNSDGPPLSLDWYTIRTGVLTEGTPVYGMEETLPSNTMSTSVSLVSPLNNSNFSSGLIWFNSTATAFNGNLTNATLYTFGATIKTNYSSFANTNETGINMSLNLADGKYNWSYYWCAINASTTSCNWTDNRTFTIDTINPTVKITAPIDSIYSYKNVTLNYSATDANLDSCWYSLNGQPNASLPGCANSTIVLNAGNNSIIVYANDTFDPTHVGKSSYNYSYYFPVLSICNMTYNMTFANYTFKNETTLAEDINASISSSTWNYWFDAGINRTYSYINTSENPSYSFCIDGGNRTLYVSPSMTYVNIYSPARSYNPGILTWNNVTTNYTLFLLPSSLGLYVTFQVVDLTSAPVASADVNISSGGTLIESKLTDGAGAATFFMNPTKEYTVCASRTGYSSLCTSIVPTQTQYTLTLSLATTASADYTRGISYSTQPYNYELGNDTNYLFNFTLNSSFWTVTNWGYNIYDQNGNNLAAANSVGNGGYLSSILNTRSNQSFTMNSFWVINNTFFNVSKTWIIINTADNQYSILHFFQRFNQYTNASSTGLFGLQNSPNNNFSFSLIIFLIIFTSAGILSYKYGLTSPAAIMVVIFGLVYFFDVVVGVLPRLPTAPNIPSATIITLIILTALIIKEAQR